jgi:kinesin family protein 11
MLQSEKAKTEKAKDELIQTVSGLLDNFTRDRERGWREAVEVAQGGNGKAAEGMTAFMGKHGALMEEVQDKGAEVRTRLEKKGGEGKRTREGALKVSPRL